ncbi:MAG TPA: YHS domain-containing protein [Gemmatimonadaceae bacterium]|jgi:YHS domain-containing protein|nr:YHS domain-containing protein [Gemmatimonadaceae bacterium]
MATVKDPVCGMMIDSESAEARREVAGQTYYFCSSACATKFDEAPDRYATAASTADESADESLEQHEPPFTTRRGFTAPKFGAAGSGGLEYELPPEAHDK